MESIQPATGMPIAPGNETPGATLVQPGLTLSSEGQVEKSSVIERRVVSNGQTSALQQRMMNNPVSGSGGFGGFGRFMGGSFAGSGGGGGGGNSGGVIGAGDGDGHNLGQQDNQSFYRVPANANTFTSGYSSTVIADNSGGGSPANPMGQFPEAALEKSAVEMPSGGRPAEYKPGSSAIVVTTDKAAVPPGEPTSLPAVMWRLKMVERCLLWAMCRWSEVCFLIMPILSQLNQHRAPLSPRTASTGWLGLRLHLPRSRCQYHHWRVIMITLVKVALSFVTLTSRKQTR